MTRPIRKYTEYSCKSDMLLERGKIFMASCMASRMASCNPPWLKTHMKWRRPHLGEHSVDLQFSLVEIRILPDTNVIFIIPLMKSQPSIAHVTINVYNIHFLLRCARQVNHRLDLYQAAALLLGLRVIKRAPSLSLYHVKYLVPARVRIEWDNPNSLIICGV